MPLSPEPRGSRFAGASALCLSLMLLGFAADLPARATDEPAHPPLAPKNEQLQRILALARADQHAWGRLSLLCDDVGHRLAGSVGLEQAVQMTAGWFRADLQENVVTEPVMVPVWLRGEESLRVVAPVERELGLLGLGGTVGTRGVEADVVVLHSFAELSTAVKGKIVVFNVPMRTTLPAIAQYGDAVAFRSQGASRAAAFGAVAVLVRSVTTRSLYTPHTGALRYDPALPQIPAAAITAEDADWMDRMGRRGQIIRLRLELGARALPDKTSHNVLAELRGGKKANEVVVIGAHLDSWDLGQGAHDDGAGVVEVVEALRLLRALGVKPDRTIRAVLFTNEENGLRGGTAYAATHGVELHRALLESDLGGGWPLSWSATGSPAQMEWLRRVAAPLGMPIEEGGGGADISPFEAKGALVIGLHPDDSHYFDVHHTRADTVDKVDPVALADGTGAVASLAWLLANAPD